MIAPFNSGDIKLHAALVLRSSMLLSMSRSPKIEVIKLSRQKHTVFDYWLSPILPALGPEMTRVNAMQAFTIAGHHNSNSLLKVLLNSALRRQIPLKDKNKQH